MLRVKPLSGALGAEISGVDLTDTHNKKMYSDIQKLLLEYEVIFFRDQNINHAQHKALAESFGDLQTHPAYTTVDGHPEISVLKNTPEAPSKIKAWHTDMTFCETPPMGAVLRCKVSPPKGGDTLWASATVAYNNLSKKMQDFVSNLRAVHDFRRGFNESLNEPEGLERLAQAVKDNPPVEHPVVRTHPQNGKKTIFVNALFTTHIIDMNIDESDALLNFLYNHIVKPEFTCRFSWQPDSIAIWDGRCTQHKPVNDYFPAYREMERIAINGEKPF